MSVASIMESENINEFPGSQQLKIKQAKIGLYVFLGVVTSLFFLFIVALVIRSQLSDWEHLSAPWRPLANPWFLWINTAMLMLSSIALQWARVSSKNNHLPSAIKGFVLAGLFTIAFLVGQILVWKQFILLGYYVSSNPANSFFYLLTGLHALHLLGGLLAWLRTCFKIVKHVEVAQLASSIELCAIYWHYLSALWLVLFALLVSSPETFAAIAQLCGFSV